METKTGYHTLSSVERGWDKSLSLHDVHFSWMCPLDFAGMLWLVLFNVQQIMHSFLVYVHERAVSSVFLWGWGLIGIWCRVLSLSWSNVDSFLSIGGGVLGGGFMFLSFSLLSLIKKKKKIIKFFWYYFSHLILCHTFFSSCLCRSVYHRFSCFSC